MDERRKRIIAACVPRTRLHKEGLFADIVEDRRCHPALFLCIVQKRGSSEILFFGQFTLRPEAESAALQFMANHLRQEVSAAALGNGGRK